MFCSEDLFRTHSPVYLACAQLEQADLPAAVGALRRLAARAPHSPQAHHALAAALHRQALELSALGNLETMHD